MVSTVIRAGTHCKISVPSPLQKATRAPFFREAGDIAYTKFPCLQTVITVTILKAVGLRLTLGRKFAGCWAVDSLRINSKQRSCFALKYSKLPIWAP